MNAVTFELALHRMDKIGIWLLTPTQSGVLYPDESTETLKLDDAYN